MKISVVFLDGSNWNYYDVVGKVRADGEGLVLFNYQSKRKGAEKGELDTAMITIANMKGLEIS